MQLSTSQLNGWHVVTLVGNLDQAGSTVLAEAIDPLPADTSIALDFAELKYVTSAGFRLLLSTDKRLRQGGGRLYLGNLKPSVLQVFEIAGLSEVIVITQNLQATIAPDS